MKNHNILIGAALAGLVFTGGAMAGNKTEKASDVKCHGINGCRGKGACGGAKTTCAGTNECKGKGWLKMSAKECAKKGGKAEEMKPMKMK